MIDSVQQMFPNIPESLIVAELRRTRNVQVAIESLLARNMSFERNTNEPTAAVKNTNWKTEELDVKDI